MDLLNGMHFVCVWAKRVELGKWGLGEGVAFG